nr:type II secretion system F family protein [Angustibacter aerolatus]
MALLVLVAAWFLPELALRSARRRRQRSIDRDIPDFLDVLAVTVSAGLSFRAALERVASRYTGALADEITHTLREMDVGESRRNAFQRLRERNASEALDQFVVALLQAEEPRLAAHRGARPDRRRDAALDGAARAAVGRPHLAARRARRHHRHGARRAGAARGLAVPVVRDRPGWGARWLRR